MKATTFAIIIRNDKVPKLIINHLNNKKDGDNY